MVTEFFIDNLDAVFFFYGIAFIILGIIIFAQLKLTLKSEFKIIGILWILGFFGLSHGIHEIVDMFTLIKGKTLLFQIIGPLALFISYLSIFLFGYLLININKKRLGIKFLSAVILLFIGLPVLSNVSSYISWSISSRYFLGFTGSILTSFGLLKYYKDESKKLNKIDVKKYFMYSALFFAIYGILGGLVVPKASFFPASVINNEAFNQIVGIPVQLFRTFCAIGITFSMLNIINIFNVEAVNKQKKSQEFTRTIFDNVNDSISIVDIENFNIIDVNKKFLDSLNIRKEDVVGKKCYEVTHKRTEPCVPPDDVCPIDEMLQTGKSVLVEHVHYEKDGNKIYGEVTASPIFDDNGKVVSAVHISRDITERKKAEIDLLKAYAEMEKKIEERTRDLKQSERKLQSLYEIEHNIADTLQKASLTIPEKIENVDFGHIYKSATETALVGGDLYDLFELEQNKVGIVIGDVSGKGLGAATLTSLIKNTIKAYAYHENSPALVMNRTNNIILKNSPEEVFVTLFFGILDKESGLLTYCSAGHPPPILRRKNTEVISLVTKSPIIGVFDIQDFVDEKIILENDDALILFTDGITEAKADDELFGEERLLKVIEEIQDNLRVKDYPDFIIEKVSDFAKGSLADDIAILAISLSK